MPANVVVLELGSRVPADLRPTAANALQVDEFLLTGESTVVTKRIEPVPRDAALGDRRSMAYTGSVVTSGRALGIVVATGQDTELGTIADLVRSEPTANTPMQDRMERFARLIGLAVVVVAVIAYAPRWRPMTPRRHYGQMPASDAPPGRDGSGRAAPSGRADDPAGYGDAVRAADATWAGAAADAPTAEHANPATPQSSGAPGAARGDHARWLVDRYRLDGVIGKGSMGTVWEATDEVLHRKVAIKEIDYPPGMPHDEVAMLEKRTLREARAIAALSNPFVITLFDILILDSGPVIVMELLRARSVSELLKQVGRLTDGQAATIGVAVSQALLAAHAAGITHRDVKPGNVLVCDDGRIKLTDFGIARSAGEQTMTMTGLLLGSPAYIAPETANGVPAGPVSDAWGLGGLLYACVEGRPPFDQGTAIATLTSVVKDPVPPHPNSGRLGGVISGLLVKTPHLRMRIDKALQIMRTVADDPAGSNLVIGGHAAPQPEPGSAFVTPPSGLRSAVDADAASGGAPGSQQSPGVSAGGASAGAAGHAPAAPAAGAPSGVRSGRPPGASSEHPPGASPMAWQYPPSHQPPSHQPPSHQPPSVRSASQQPTFQRPSPRQPTSQRPDMPPPPWAVTGAAELAPIPEVADPRADRPRIIAAILLAIVAAVAGFFGVRFVADMGATSGSGGSGAAAAAVAEFAAPAVSPQR